MNLSTTEQVSMTDLEALLLQKKLDEWKDSKIKTLQNSLDLANNRLMEYKPKADFYDQVTGSKDAIEMKEVAKILNCGIGRNKLFELLRDKKVLMENNSPYQKYIDCGYFRLIEQSFQTSDGETHINLKTVVYQKGMDFIRKLIEG